MTKKDEAQEIMEYVASLAIDFTETGNEYIIRDTLQGPEKKHKIYEMYHRMGAMHGLIWWRDQRISELNDKIRELGIELSKLKRAQKS